MYIYKYSQTSVIWKHMYSRWQINLCLEQQKKSNNAEVMYCIDNKKKQALFTGFEVYIYICVC